MTQQEKDLLLKDLCGRLPYGVKVHKKNSELNGTLIDTELRHGLMVITTNEISVCAIPLDKCRPYLRPMSSMTEEEIKEFAAFHCLNDWHPIVLTQMLNLENEENMFDWLNSHCFDYRGLIEKGLAIEAPEGMYNF